MKTESSKQDAEKNCGAAIGIMNEVVRKVDDTMDKNFNFRGDGMVNVLSSHLENLEVMDYTLPQSICTLVNKILDVQQNDIVAEINCGIGRYLDATIKAYPEIKLVGVEREHDKLEMADMNLRNTLEQRDVSKEFMTDIFNRKAPQYDHQITLCNADPFYYYNGFAVKDIYDKAFSYMSERVRLREERAFEEYIRDSKLYHVVRYHTTSDWYFNEMLVKSIKENGKAVALMNSGAMNNKIDEESRKFFVENGYIEAVIKLPKKLALRMRSSVLVILSHNNKAIRFVDASCCYVDGRRSNELSEKNIETILGLLQHDNATSKVADCATVSQAGFALNPERYLITEVDIKESMLLGDALKVVKRAVPLKANVLDEAATVEETSVKYIRLADLQDGLVSENLCCLKELEDKWSKYVLDSNDLIISKITKPCKMAVYNKDGDEAVVMVGNMYALTLDDKKINPYYLQAYLESEQGAAALTACSTGSTLPIISVDALKNLQIPVPAMSVQIKIAERCIKLLQDIKMHKQMLNKAVEELGKVYNVE